MLQLADFTDITVQGDYREETATADHGMLVYLARKEGESYMSALAESSKS